MFRRITPCLLLLLVCATTSLFPSSSLYAAQGPDPQSSLIAQLRTQSGGDLAIAYHEKTGAVRFLSGTTNRAVAHIAQRSDNPEDISRAFLATYGSLFGIQNQATDLTVMRQEVVGTRKFVRFQQHYQGIPVLGGELVVQTDGRQDVMSINGEIMPNLELSVAPAVAAQKATEAAIAKAAKTYNLPASAFTASQPQLWVYNPVLLGGPGLPLNRLVWRTEVKAPGQPIRELVLVDAQKATIALNFNQIADAKKRFVCNDNNVIDADHNEKNNCTPDKYVRSEGQAATGNTDVDLAYDYAGLTYDFFFTNFGRDSLDGKGLPLISLVKYCPSAQECSNGSTFQNAFWDGQQMTYGDGLASADDVVAHELSHGLTEFTSGLLYYYQSGAINESLSDVFGELVDQAYDTPNDNDAPSDRWLLGEDLPPSVGIVRNMQDPPQLGNPDKISSPLYSGDPSDSGGVHNNSGVNNKAAYLMVDGGSFNGQTISPIGAQKAAAIYYTTEIAYLTSASDYEDLFNYLQAACSTLASNGSYGITTNDCAQVKKAALAVEMDQTPPAAPVPEAPVCAVGQTSIDAFYDDFENSGSGNWQASATAGSPSTLSDWYNPANSNPYGLDVRYATSGKGNLWGNDQGSNDSEDPNAIAADYNIAMTRDITVPQNAYFHFRHAYEFESDFNAAYDGGVVEYSTNGGSSWNDAGALFDAPAGFVGYNATLDSTDNPLNGRQAFSGISQGYYSARMNLSSLAGQQVRFRFRIGTDKTNFPDPDILWYGWFIDDVRLYSCATALPVVSVQSTDRTVAETDGIVGIDVALNGSPSQDVSIPFTVSGSATAGTDYQLESNTIVIPAGHSTGKINIRILDNATPGNKTLVVTLGTPTGATLGTPGSVTLTIQDNDTVAGSRKTFLPLTVR